MGREQEDVDDCSVDMLVDLDDGGVQGYGMSACEGMSSCGAYEVVMRWMEFGVDGLMGG